MIDLNSRKKIVNNQFEYLQIQICKQFENVEKKYSTKSKKFFIRECKKSNKHEGGGKSFML